MSKQTKIIGAVIFGFILILGIGDLLEGKPEEFTREFDHTAVTPSVANDQDAGLQTKNDQRERPERLATITPESFDGIVMGMHIAEVANTLTLKELNKEVKIVDGRERDVYRVYRNEHMLYEIDTACSEEPGTCTVVRITSLSPYVQTKEGFGVGSKSGDIFGAYGVESILWEDGYLFVVTKMFPQIRFGFLERDVPSEWIKDGENIAALSRTMECAIIELSKRSEKQ